MGLFNLAPKHWTSCLNTSIVTPVWSLGNLSTGGSSRKWITNNCRKSFWDTRDICLLTYCPEVNLGSTTDKRSHSEVTKESSKYFWSLKTFVTYLLIPIVGLYKCLKTADMCYINRKLKRRNLSLLQIERS